MKRYLVGVVLVLSVLFVAGCQDKYDPSVHESTVNGLMNELENLGFVELATDIENPIEIYKFDDKDEYDGRGKINEYWIKIYLADEKQTMHDWWTVAYTVDQFVSNKQLIGVGTSSEGAYTGVRFYTDDKYNSLSFIDLTFSVSPEHMTTYQEFMIRYYDENDEPVYSGGYIPENALQKIHRY